jgi:hypothetical protein
MVAFLSNVHTQLTPIEDTILPSTVTDADVTRCTTILMESPKGGMIDSNKKSKKNSNLCVVSNDVVLALDLKSVKRKRQYAFNSFNISRKK